MSKLTVLKIVQKVLTSMESDEVESINDTTEAEDVASIAQDVYMDMTTWDEWPHQQSVGHLLGLSDTEHPTALALEDDNISVINIKYKVEDSPAVYRTIKYVDPATFLEHGYSLATQIDRAVPVKDVTDDNLIYYVTQDRDPEYYTTFDDKHLIFNSYNKEKDTTLQGSKSVVLAEKMPVFLLEDEFIPDLPIDMMSMFLSEVRANCHIWLKQQQSPKDEKRVLRGLSRSRQKKNRIQSGEYNERARQDHGRHSRNRSYRSLGRR